YSARVSWRHGAWYGQVSGGRLKFPDPTEFTDVNRWTSSIGYAGLWLGRRLDALVAVGVNRKPQLNVTSAAWLAEATWHVTANDSSYARIELVDQDILTAGGYDPPDFVRPHTLSRVGALTGGYERRVIRSAHGHVGLGADATIYRT